MILVYLNPTSTPIWDDDEPRNDAHDVENIVEALFREPPMQPHTLYHEILQCYTNMLSRSKEVIDDQIRTCVRIIEKDRKYIPALLCMAVALALNGQQSKARNQLKRICKLSYDPTFADEFEASYLMLSSLYIENKKYD